MAANVAEGPKPRSKAPLGSAAALAVAILLSLCTAVLAPKTGTLAAEASKGQWPSFDAASIKVNTNAPRAFVEIFTVSKNRFTATESAINMIMLAYGDKYPLKPAQVLDGPDWMKTEVFNIDAELPKSMSDQLKPGHMAALALLYPDQARQTDELKQVFRSLLINRFKLRIRHETKVLPVTELVLAENGPKVAADKTANGSCRITDVGPEKGLWLDVNSCDFRTLAGLLSAEPELRSRVLVDKTGLHGRYSFKIHLTRNSTPSEPPGLLVSAALRKELGLKVTSATAPVDTIAIEHIDNPVKN